MDTEGPAGWGRLLAGYRWFESAGCFPLPAYSEFMPPPRLGRAPYGEVDATLFAADDPYGWRISELEEEYELRPGLEHVVGQIMEHLLNLGRGLPEYHTAGHSGWNLKDNPYWPPSLAERAGHLEHERYVVFLPLALSRTQDDKGRVRWTFFGSSEQGPERAFWKSFYSAPGQETPRPAAREFIVRLLSSAYGEPAQQPEQLHALGFRILPAESEPALPGWTTPYLLDESRSLEGVRYLLTFRPFSELPAAVQGRYLAGHLALLPFPGSLVFWGMPSYRRLQQRLPLAMQIPLLHLVARHGGPAGLRVPQSGWIHEPCPGVDPATVQQELLQDSYQRTHRWMRVHRHEDELAHNPRVDKLVKVLFSTDLETMGLYDKPLARNCQLWTKDFELLLDGPNATPPQIRQAEDTLVEGGLFGYRFLFPAMRVGRHEVYWQRPAVAYLSARSDRVELLPDAPLGYMTAYREGAIDLAQPVQLWPRLCRRPAYLAALRDFENPHDHYAHQTALNILSLLDNRQALGEGPLPRSFARQLLRLPKAETLEQWLGELPGRCRNAESAALVQAELEGILEPAETVRSSPPNLTYGDSATRAFEEGWWNDIQTLARGRYSNKDNADCVQDPVTLSLLKHHSRDLEPLGDYLLGRHRQAVEQAEMAGQAVCGELPFLWRTDFDFATFGGWRRDQEGQSYERDILVLIPGKDRREAVVLADHYDTAYMEDVYEKARGGSGARLSAAGADDNYSATATLLQAAPIFLRLARQGLLERDVWLLHLTGEEFPADCLGARHFCQALVEKTLQLRLPDGTTRDLSGIKVLGVFVLDMVGHNRDDDQDVFQISPGKSPHSVRLAHEAHLANLAWNAGTRGWNAGEERRGRKREQRSVDGRQTPAIAAHLPLSGEIRTQDDPLSSLYNTDGQIFSDVGVPVVLFMENYDLNRTGYHDTKDTPENIDLDYGAALAAIAIETVARAASLPPQGAPRA